MWKQLLLKQSVMIWNNYGTIDGQNSSSVYIAAIFILRRRKSWMGRFTALTTFEYRNTRQRSLLFIYINDINVRAFTKSIRRLPCNFLLSSVIIVLLLVLAFNENKCNRCLFRNNSYCKGHESLSLTCFEVVSKSLNK